MPLLSLKTTPFRKAVWEIMLTIPFGETMTYKEIANEIAKQRGQGHMSAQAVGGAVGHNSISLMIPCHRVVGTKGNLTGSAGGSDKKLWLLEMEKADRTAFCVPEDSEGRIPPAGQSRPPPGCRSDPAARWPPRAGSPCGW